MKEFIYLVQGQADFIKKYLDLADRDSSDAVFLTYDQPVNGATFLPNSTWAQGRNKLFEIALNTGSYRYYIFCDDDIEFKIGGWDKFERNLKDLAPAIAVPVFIPKTKKTPLSRLKYQSFLINDEQLMAFHNKVFTDGVILPYYTQFDHLHWWASCEIQEILIQNFYPYDSIQFNDIHVINRASRRYPHLAQNIDYFKKAIRVWLSANFRYKFKDIYLPSKKTYPLVLWRTVRFLLHRFPFLKTSRHGIDEGKIRNALSPDSEILQRYLSQRSAHAS